MPLESGTYISELNSSNPPGTDQRKQGDDHLRLIKATLQSTFPNASKGFRFPVTSAKTVAYTVLSSDQNSSILCSTTGGAYAVTLPTLAAGDSGWIVQVIKTTNDANQVSVAPAAGTINNEASLKLNNIYDALTVLWTGTAWLAITDRNSMKIRAITANVTLDESDFDGMVVCTPAAATTITLPAVAGYIGRVLSIKHIAVAGALITTTIDADAAETIDGATTLALINNTTVMLLGTTGGWVNLLQDTGPTTLVSAVTLSGATYTIDATTIKRPFRKFELIWTGASHNSGASRTLQFELSSDNGATWTGAFTVGNALTAAQVSEGRLDIYSADSLASVSRLMTYHVSDPVGVTFNVVGQTLAGYINAIRISWTAGSHDAGSISLIGV